MERRQEVKHTYKCKKDQTTNWNGFLWVHTNHSRPKWWRMKILKKVITSSVWLKNQERERQRQRQTNRQTEMDRHSTANILNVFLMHKHSLWIVQLESILLSVKPSKTSSTGWPVTHVQWYTKKICLSLTICGVWHVVFVCVCGCGCMGARACQQERQRN